MEDDRFRLMAGQSTAPSGAFTPFQASRTFWATACGNGTKPRPLAASPPFSNAQSKNRNAFRVGSTLSAAGLVGTRTKVGETIGHASAGSASTTSKAKLGAARSAVAAAAAKAATSGFTKRPALLRSWAVTMLCRMALDFST